MVQKLAGEHGHLPTKMSAHRHPSDMLPLERREYLRRFPHMAWWLRQADGNHPDYPGMFQDPRPTASPPSPSENVAFHLFAYPPYSVLFVTGPCHLNPCKKIYF